MNTDEQPNKSTIVPAGPRGIELRSLDDYWRFSKAVVEAGMVPPGILNAAGVLLVLQRGAEVGLLPMQSLQSIYIVNNIPQLYGDAPKGICEASGLLERCEEEYQGTYGEEDYKAVVTIKRRGKKERVSEFSIADAKRAQLWERKTKDGKPTPWVLYPKRMLLFRARGYGLRDEFSDLLKGFPIRELSDDEAADGAKPVAGRVIEPNLPKTETVAPAAEAPPKRGPGRPKKEQSPTADLAAGRYQVNEPTPAVPTATTSGPDDDPTISELGLADNVQQRAVHGPKPGTRPLVEEVKAKLAEAKRTPEEFTRLLYRFALIETAQMPLEVVSDQTLKMALDDWPTIKQTFEDLAV